MRTDIFFSVFLICLISLYVRVNAFCAIPSEGLHADLTQAVVRSSDWLKQIYKANTTSLFPHRAASMITILRIAGHMPKTLLSEFKDRNGLSIEETLKNYLDLKNTTDGNLNGISGGRLGLIIQAVVAICQNPKDFHGHNLFPPLYYVFGLFKKSPTFNNYFKYSLAVMALCVSGRHVPVEVVRELINGAYRIGSHHSGDINSLILQALSCISNSSLQTEVNEASGKIVQQLISRQNKTTGAFGNQYSTAHVIMALQAARVHTDSYLCDKAMRNILAYQDKEGSFGTILANIRVSSALLGESLISLKKYACPVEQPPTLEPPPIISVYVQLIFNVTNLTRTEPMLSVNIRKGQTAYHVLEMAKVKNSCYTAEYLKLAWGRSVTSICGVTKKPMLGYYWLIRVNGKRPQYGIDGIKPKDGFIITFKYMKITF